VSTANEILSHEASPGSREKPGGEGLLLCGSLLSLIASCILWSPHKQAWMDEIFTWKEVSDPSLWHLYYAIQHGADGGQPLFYTTAWLWARAFGTGVLALRLYSCIAMCGALLVSWRTVRRFYGVRATAFGVLFFWGTSGVLLDQNAEARFYGLYLLAVAVTVDLYTRLVAREAPRRTLFLFAFLSQAALALTHVLGIIYSGVILLALILFDAAKGRLRFKLYLVYAAGWLTLLVWIPAIRASMAAGRPRGWIAMPTLTDLRTAYLFADLLPWLRLFKRHSLEGLFQLVSHAAELIIYLALAVVLLIALRRVSKFGWQTISDPRGALLLVGYLLLSVPVVLFVLSHLVTPVFVSRYLLPSGIGLSIVMAAAADALGSDSRSHARSTQQIMWAGIVLLLMLAPALTAFAVEPIRQGLNYLDVHRLDQVTPPNVAVVAGWQQDFVKIMRYSQNPNNHYYYLLDWPGALAGPRGFILDYHLMRAYRDNGYYANSIQDNRSFLCSHQDFAVLDAPHGDSLEVGTVGPSDPNEPNWFDTNIRRRPEFQWEVITSFDGSEVTRRLIAVHRNKPLPICESQ
jgi:uncharacterized membrane protein